MKKLNVSKILLILVAILPILDMISYIFRNSFNTSFSPSTFLRPVIPIVSFAIIFFQGKFKLKSFLICAIYAIYAVVHLILFYFIKSESSYGSILSEAQYLINYSFMILNLFLYIFCFKNSDTENLKKYIKIACGIYVISIYISILVGISSTTYVEGMGYKGLYESGNSLGATILLMLFIIFPTIHINKNVLKDKNTIITILLIILTGIFLCLLLGTRTGLFGFAIVTLIYVFLLFINKFSKVIFKNKKILFSGIAVVLLLVISVAVLGTNVLQRRKYLQSIQNDIIDEKTGKASCVTGDTLKFLKQIEQNSLDENFLPEQNQKAMQDLYDIANKYEISGTNRRVQQLIYNIYLQKHQNNIALILFGNGYLANYGELILEMEIPALLLNFGVIGFLLYFVPLLAVLIYAIKIGIKYRKKVDVEFVMYVIGLLFAFALATFTSAVFFNSSCMIVICAICALIVNKCMIMQKEDINIKQREKEAVTV